MSRLGIYIRSLLDNLQVNKRANYRGNLTWVEVLPQFRNQLLGIALVPTRTISGVSNAVIGIGIPGVIEVPSVTKGVASSSVDVLEPISYVSSSRFP